MEEQLKSNFITDCLCGDAFLTDIDDYIDRWHDTDGSMPIYLFLGMTKKEYDLFVQDEEYLAYIVKAHKDKEDITNIIATQIPFAARSDETSKSERLNRWLESEGLWE